MRIFCHGGWRATVSVVADEALLCLDSRYLISTEALAGGHRTPSSTVYNDLLNSRTGPWVQAASEAIFGPESDIEAALQQGEETMQQIMDMAGN